jgi:hypothetical protein
MWDNFSTIGNINPYTGKPGWIVPYDESSSSYFLSVPRNGRFNAHEFFDYLKSHDSVRFFQMLRDFDYPSTLFFSGLYYMETDQYEVAAPLFKKVLDGRTPSEFLMRESKRWFDVSNEYAMATQEFRELWDNIEAVGGFDNSAGTITQTDKVRHPLNQLDKYSIRMLVEQKRHNYRAALIAVDSMYNYLPTDESGDSLRNEYNDIKDFLQSRQAFITTTSNGTFHYDGADLFENLRYFIGHHQVPEKDMRTACFKYVSMTNEKGLRVVYERTLIDTANVKETRMNTLFFEYYPRNTSRDTLYLARYIFSSPIEFERYKSELESDFPRTIAIERSLGFLSPKDNLTFGREHLINDLSIIGLTAPKENEYGLVGYELYIYFIKTGDTWGMLSNLFK